MKIFAWHRYPPGWYVNEDGQLQMELNCTLLELINGFTTSIVLPWSEDQDVTVSAGTPMIKIVNGFKVIGEGVGIPSHDGERGNVSVLVQWDHKDRIHFDKKAMLEVAGSSGYYDDDFMYLYLVKRMEPGFVEERRFDFSDEDDADTIVIIDEKDRGKYTYGNDGKQEEEILGEKTTRRKGEFLDKFKKWFSSGTDSITRDDRTSGDDGGGQDHDIDSNITIGAGLNNVEMDVATNVNEEVHTRAHDDDDDDESGLGDGDGGGVGSGDKIYVDVEL